MIPRRASAFATAKSVVLAAALFACSQRPSHLEGKQPVDYLCAGPGACRIHIAATPPIDVPIPVTLCSGAMDLAESSDGKTVAYRCHASGLEDAKRWSAVRLRGNGRYLNDCSAPLGTGEKPKLEALGTIASAGIRLLDCGESDPDVWAEIVQSIEEESGGEAAAAFEIATSLRAPQEAGPKSIHLPPAYADGWVSGFAKLDAAARATVRAEICPAIHNTLTGPLQFVRGLRTCPLDDATPDALRWLHDALAASQAEFVRARKTDAADAPIELNASELALATAGALAVKANPAAASAVACGAIGSLQREGDPVRVAVAGSIIALAKTRCPALETYSQLWPCDLESPIKVRAGEAVARFGAAKPGAPPVVPPANYAMSDALTIDGKLPAAYVERKADGGLVGSMCP